MVPLNDLARMSPELQAQIRHAIDSVVESGWYVMGPQHDALESELAAYAGADHAVLLGNGTDALELALAAVGVTAGDSVVTVANAGAYTSIAARLLGAEPVYADVDERTMLISAETLEAALAGLADRPKAVVVTHLYGALAPIEEIVTVARRHGIAVVEDCAQSFGATLGGRKGGTFGDVATVSFYPTKNLGALGDGGAVITSRSDIADAVRRMRQYGWSAKYRIAHPHGRNSRMDEMQAAILRVKLPLLDAMNERRREIHLAYESVENPGFSMVNRAAESFIAHLGVMIAADRTAVRAALTDAGVGTDVHYPIPDHHQPFPGGYTGPSLPVTEWAADHVLSVPTFPELSDEEVAHVRAALDSL
ncbi:DegT/DnrJ/EryC1/StrS family aminotransferase [Agromyces sp. NPDC055520]